MGALENLMDRIGGASLGTPSQAQDTSAGEGSPYPSRKASSNPTPSSWSRLVADTRQQQPVRDNDAKNILTNELATFSGPDENRVALEREFNNRFGRLPTSDELQSLNKSISSSPVTSETLPTEPGIKTQPTSTKSSDLIQRMRDLRAQLRPERDLPTYVNPADQPITDFAGLVKTREKDAEERQAGEGVGPAIKDAAKATTMGVLGLGEMATNLLYAGTGAKPAKDVADWLGKGSEHLKESMTPQMREASEKKFFNNDLSFGEAVSDPRAYLFQFYNQLGSAIPMIGGGRLIGMGAEAVAGLSKMKPAIEAAGVAAKDATQAAIANGVENVAALQAGKDAAQATFATEAGKLGVKNASLDDTLKSMYMANVVGQTAAGTYLHGSDAANAAMTQIAQMPHEKLMGSPSYAQAYENYKQSLPESEAQAKAKEDIRRSAGLDAAATTATMALPFQIIMGRVNAKLFSDHGMGYDSRLKNFGAAAAQEVPANAAELGMVAYGGNVGIQGNADPTHPLNDDVVNTMANAAIGAVGMAGMHAVKKPNSPLTNAATPTTSPPAGIPPAQGGTPAQTGNELGQKYADVQAFMADPKNLEMLGAQDPGMPDQARAVWEYINSPNVSPELRRRALEQAHSLLTTMPNFVRTANQPPSGTPKLASPESPSLPPPNEKVVSGEVIPNNQPLLPSTGTAKRNIDAQVASDIPLDAIRWNTPGEKAYLLNLQKDAANGKPPTAPTAQVPAQSDQGRNPDVPAGGTVVGQLPDAAGTGMDNTSQVAAPAHGEGVAVGATGTPAVAPIAQEHSPEIHSAAHQAATSPHNDLPQPTAAQIEAGNYKKGHVTIQGLNVSIENPKDSIRSGVSPEGKAWSQKLNSHYGYFKGTIGADKDHVDVFVEPGAEKASKAWVIDQVNRDGSYDEHKVVLGPETEEEARAAYLANYEEGWQGIGAITPLPIPALKAWLDSNKTKKPLAYKAPLSEINQRASNVYQHILSLGRKSAIPEGNAQWVNQITEQIDNPNRYGRVQEDENPKGLKVGDRIQTEDGSEEYVLAVQKTDAKAYEGGYAVHTIGQGNFGGWVGIDTVEKYSGKPEDTAESVLGTLADIPDPGMGAKTEKADHWLHDEIKKLIFAKGGTKQRRRLDKIIEYLKQRMAGEDVRHGKIKAGLADFKHEPKLQEILTAIHARLEAEDKQAASKKRQATKLANKEKDNGDKTAQAEQAGAEEPKAPAAEPVAPADDRSWSASSMAGVEHTHNSGPVWEWRYNGSHDFAATEILPEYPQFYSQALVDSLPADVVSFIQKQGRDRISQYEELYGTGSNGVDKLSPSNPVQAGETNTVNAENMTLSEAIKALTDGKRLERFGDTTWIEETKVGQKGQTYVIKSSDGFTKGPVGEAAKWGWSALDAAQQAVKSWKFKTEAKAEKGLWPGQHFDYTDPMRGEPPELTEAKRKVVDYMNGDIDRAAMIKALVDSNLPQGTVRAITNRLSEHSLSNNEVDSIVKQQESAGESQQTASALSYEEFRKQYLDAFNQMMKYKPNEVGSGVFAEKMAKLSDAYPEYAERVEAEKPAAPKVKTEKAAEPAWWSSKTGAERVWLLNASGIKNATANTQWNRLTAEQRKALDEQWGDGRKEELSPLTKALNDLAEMEARAEAQGRVVDDRLLQKIRQQKALVKELETEEKKSDHDKGMEKLAAGFAADDKASEMDSLKAEMAQAVDELASLFGTKLNMTPEEETKLIPIVSKMFRIAAKMGYIKFKEAAQYVMQQIRKLAGDATADKISIDNLSAGYINIAREIGGDRKEALSYDSIEELMADIEKPEETSYDENTEVKNDDRGTEAPSSGTLDGVAPEEVGSTGERGPRGSGVEQSSDSGGTRDSAVDESGSAAGRGGRDSVAGTDSAEAGKGSVAGSRGGRRSKGSKTSKDRSESLKEVAEEKAEEKHAPLADFTIGEDVSLGSGGQMAKYRDNIAAIKLIKQLEEEKRRATPAEQRTLARYVGWGGIPNAFRNPISGEVKADWEKEVAELESLLTPRELRAASASTRNAHYTSQSVVNFMWRAASRLGFNGGLVLEPSVGTGNFIGLMPDHLRAATNMTGIELDSLTARIAGALYPRSNIIQSGFEKLPLPDDHFDMAIGNPPFGAEGLRFKYSPELNGASIHNQFFRASLNAVKPGGLQVMIVSRFLMDKQGTSDRMELAKNAKLLGAIRLPGMAFKGNALTEVVTDILFLQKRTPYEAGQISQALYERGKKVPAKEENDAMVARLQRAELLNEAMAWVDTGTVKDPNGGDPITVNKYFIDNPHMIAGVLDRTGSMRQQNDIDVKLRDGETLEQAMDQAMQFLPNGVKEHRSDEVIGRTLDLHKQLGESMSLYATGAEEGAIRFEPDGSLTQVIERVGTEGELALTKITITPTTPWSPQLSMNLEGKWFRVVRKDDANGKPIKQMKDGKATNLNVYEREIFDKESDVPSTLRLGAKSFAIAKQLISVRDLMVEQLNLETNSASTEAMEANRTKLRAAYEAFVKEHGLISEPKNSGILSDMPDEGLLLSLEQKYKREVTEAKAKRTGMKPSPASAEPNAILTRPVGIPPQRNSHADTIGDAVAMVLSESGRLDMDRLQELRGIPVEDVKAELTSGENPLAYADPEQGNTLVDKNEYLSGNVRRKLEAARESGLQTNIAALEAVQPEPWSSDKVTPKIGSTWIPAQVFADFADHLLGTDDARVTFAKLTNTFQVYAKGEGAEATTQWGTPRMAAPDILQAMLNSRKIAVYDPADRDGGPYFNEVETDKALDKSKEILEAFDGWIFKDAERRQILTQLFNDEFNVRVNRQHDGSHMKFPGKVPDSIISLRRGQINAIWRGVVENFVLYDHAVGAGKTFTGIARAMERRRMGLSKKPMIVVPNHLVKEWQIQTYRLYPGAKVLAATKKDLEPKNRRRLFAKVAAGDWDLVIVPHSSFGMISLSQETEERFLEAQLQLAAAALKAAEEEQDSGSRFKSVGVKAAEALIKKIENRMDAARAKKRDRLVTFEQMGVDDLTVDESHEFKNLQYSSNLTGVRGMGNPTGSDKALDMYMKIKLLHENKGSVAFMTGTPISNSAVEIYSIMRYLAPDLLNEMDLEHFDAFRTMFVDATTAFEPTDSGGSIKEVSRLGRPWSNMRALMDSYYSIADVVTNDDIKQWFAEDNPGEEFPLPNVKGGERKAIGVDPTPTQLKVLLDTIEAFDGLKYIEDIKERNAERLRLMDRARKVSLHAKAVDPTLTDEPGGKLDKAVEEITRIYKQWESDKGTQLVFLDRGVPKAKGDAAIIKAYDAAVAERDAAERDGDQTAFAKANDKLDAFDANEIAELRNAQTSNWSGYQHIKDGLIASGIPANEIAFIQDYNSDADKEALFGAVRDGSVRVLIGSTPRMGAGTNVQERLVALHHIDATWKPSDIEQREGRIIRQGNALYEKYKALGIPFEVEINTYVTKRTVDAKLWALNSMKLKMINAIRYYDGAFEMDFEDSDADNMAELAAIASGDPLMLERVQLITETEKLYRQQRSFNRRIEAAHDSILAAQKTLANGPQQIQRLTESGVTVNALLDREKKLNSERALTLMGKPFSNIGDAEWELSREILKQKNGDEKAPIDIDINGKPYTSKSAAEEELARILGDAEPFRAEINGREIIQRSEFAREIIKSTGKELAESNDFSDMGSIYGIPIKVATRITKYGNTVEIYGRLPINERGESITISASRDITPEKYKEGQTVPITVMGLRPIITRFMEDLNDAGRVTYEISVIRKRMVDAEKDLPIFEEATKETFKHADEYQQKLVRLEEVESILEGREKAAEAKANSQPGWYHVTNDQGVKEPEPRELTAENIADLLGHGWKIERTAPPKAKAPVPADALFVKDRKGELTYIKGAKPVELNGLPDHRFFIHKALPGARYKWSVTEQSTGISLARGDTQKDAIDSAKTAVERSTPQGLINAIAEHEKITDEAKQQAWDSKEGEVKFSRNTEWKSRPLASALTLAKDQSKAEELNNDLARQFNDDDWKSAFSTVQVLHEDDAVFSDFGRAFQKRILAVAPTAERFELFKGARSGNNPDILYVRYPSQNGIALAGHELYHDLAARYPELHQWFVEQAKPYIRELDRYTEITNENLSADEAYSKDEATEELLADFTGDALADPEFLQQLADDNPGKFTQLLNAVKQWLNKVIARLQGNRSEEFITDVKALRDFLAQALKVYAEGGSVADLPAPSLKFSRSVVSESTFNAVDTESPDFRRWFSGSKVVGADGTPLKVYHATPKDITEFKPGGDNPKLSGPAIWATPNAEEQQAAHNIRAVPGKPNHVYGNQSGKFSPGTNVMPLYAKITNALESTDTNWKEVYKANGIEGASPWILSADDVAKIRASGFDGIMHLGNDGTLKELAVFDPSQLKSAISNTGEFSATNPSISESRGAAITNATPEQIRQSFVKAFGEKTVRQLEAKRMIQIVATADDLPPGQTASKSGKAFWNGEKAFFIADRMNPATAYREMLHEIGEHAGLRNILGQDGYDALLKRVKDMNGKDELVSAAWNRVLKDYPEEREGSTRFMHEVLAKIGEVADIQARPWWKKLVEAFKRFLISKYGFTGFLKTGDIQDMILHSLKATAMENPTGPRGGQRLKEALASMGIAVKLSDDLSKQQDYLEAQAKQAGYSSIEEFAGQDIGAFIKSAEQWRESHPVGEMYSRAIREEGIPPGASNILSSAKYEAEIYRNPDFKAAKEGNPDAAIRFVRAQVAPSTVAYAKRAFGPQAIYVAPHAEELTGRNRIPITMTAYYAEATGAIRDEGIVQTTRAHHTDKGMMERLLGRAEFDGNVLPNRKYVLVDDVVTGGGTLAELADYIRMRGGIVAGIVTLANASQTATMRPSHETIKSVKAKYGDTLRRLFRVQPEALTAPEAEFLDRFPSFDAFRDRLAATGQEGRERLSSEGLSKSGGVAPLESRSNPLRWDGKNFIGDDVSLMKTGEIESYSTFSVLDSESKIPIGVVSLAVMPDGEITSLYNIEAYDQRQGFGSRVIDSLLATSNDDIYIENMIPKSVDFWVKMGVQLDERHSKYWNHGYGFLSRLSRREAIDTGRTAETARIVRQDESGRLGTAQKDAPNLDLDSPLDSRGAEYLDSAKAFADRFNGPTAKTFNTWWHKTVGTMYHLATINAPFKKVFDAVQNFMRDTTRIAMRAEALAPDLIPSGFFTKPIPVVDSKAISQPIFLGTLNNHRISGEDLKRGEFETEEGEIVKFSPLTDQQVGYFNQYRNSIDRSLEDLGRSELIKVFRAAGLDRSMLDAHLETTTGAAEFSAAVIKSIEDADGTDTLESWAGEAQDIQQKIEKLKTEGYAPLMRFGKYSLYFYSLDEEGNKVPAYFTLFESEHDRNQAIDGIRKSLEDELGPLESEIGIQAQENSSLFEGMTPDMAKAFAKAMGISIDEGFQEYLKRTVNNRSALKRLIHRKGTAGYSEDAIRVLASFVASNSRRASMLIHMTEAQDAANKIDRTQGDVKDMAELLIDNVKNPKEEAGALRGLMFFHLLGGSLSSALVNLTQTVLQVAPYLYQFRDANNTRTSIAKGIASAQMLSARIIASELRGKEAPEIESGLRRALDRAAEEGVTKAHEIHQLMANARGASLSHSAGAALAKLAGKDQDVWGANAEWGTQRFLKAWGSMFGLAEESNRLTAFIAAHNIAMSKGMTEAQAYEFSRKAVDETASIYNKGNRPMWGRGPIGATLFTFKQFSVQYVEFMRRLYKNDKEAFFIGVAMLVMMGGITGLPGSDDLDDLIDTFGQWMGFAANTKKARRQALEATVGQVFGHVGTDFVMNGVSAFLPIDVHARLGLGNVIPGSAMFRPDTTTDQKIKQFMEVVGPAGGMMNNAFTGLERAAHGDMEHAALAIAPTAIKNAYLGSKMAVNGYAEDTKGRRVTDTDFLDAAAKFIGVQPSVVSGVQKFRDEQNIEKAIYTNMRTTITEEWSQGMAHHDGEKTAAALQQLREWNDEHPDMRITIKPSDVMKKAMQINSDAKSRYLRSVPKPMRQEFADEMAEQ